MKIDIVTPPSRGDSFTGGLWCIYQYAQGLASRGHSVSVIPMLPSPVPRWYPQPWNFVFRSSGFLSSARHAFASHQGVGGRSGPKGIVKRAIQGGFDAGLPFVSSGLPFEYYRAASLRYLKGLLRSDADVTLATHFETALPVSLWGGSRKAYFAQHFEPLFWQGSRGQEVSKAEAMASYQLGLDVIANSTWLKEQINSVLPGKDVSVCLNAINHEHFYPSTAGSNDSTHRVTVISYGGRNVRWKGFEEMVEAMAMCRSELPEWDIAWNVYGGASIPADNPTAPYRELGFLDPSALGHAYRSADLLLSASWYESFPLFPLEAMACGLPVVTTQEGTEDFAKHGVSAEIVKGKNPESVAAGLCSLITSPGYRSKLRKGGIDAAAPMTWSRSVDRMEELLAG